jgi:hypothetical protein
LTVRVLSAIICGQRWLALAPTLLKIVVRREPLVKLKRFIIKSRKTWLARDRQPFFLDNKQY